MLLLLLMAGADSPGSHDQPSEAHKERQREMAFKAIEFVAGVWS